MQWHTQAVNITNNLKVKVDFTLPTLSTTNVVMWECHVDDSAKGRLYMILERDILTELGLMGILKGLQHPWLIWVRMYLNI